MLQKIHTFSDCVHTQQHGRYEDIV